MKFERRYVGIIKCIHASGGYAFITCGEVFQLTGQDTWVGKNELRDFQAGERISFQMRMNPKGQPQAYELEDAGREILEETDDRVPQEPGFQPLLPAAQGERLEDILDPSRRHVGQIKCIHQVGGYGFITCDDIWALTGQDTWLAKHEVGDFRIGDLVSFSVKLNPKGQPQAYEVEPAGFAEQLQHQATKPRQLTAADKLRGTAASLLREEEFEELHTGVVKWLDADKGFGYIECPDLKAESGWDVYVAIEDAEGLRQGDRVSCKVRNARKAQERPGQKRSPYQAFDLLLQEPATDEQAAAPFRVAPPARPSTRSGEPVRVAPPALKVTSSSPVRVAPPKRPLEAISSLGLGTPKVQGVRVPPPKRPKA